LDVFVHGVILHLICIIVQYLLSDSFFFFKSRPLPTMHQWSSQGDSGPRGAKCNQELGLHPHLEAERAVGPRVRHRPLAAVPQLQASGKRRRVRLLVPYMCTRRQEEKHTMEGRVVVFLSAQWSHLDIILTAPHRRRHSCCAFLQHVFPSFSSISRLFFSLSLSS